MEGMDGGGGAAGRHVGPPRTLDVQQFAAARAIEVQVLYNALKAQQEEGKLSLTTPRHLRRRTASHNRRPPFCWRSNAVQAAKKKKIYLASSESSSRPQGAPEPAAEEESSRKRKPETRIRSRRVRRRIELQGVRDGTTSCMRDGTRRLATHVWHAKRFPMTKIWGYCLPEGLPGRGRGSKAVFKWVKDAAVLHDASYIGLIELQGTEDAILRILSQTIERPPGPLSSGSHAKEDEMRGLLYGNAVLHNVGKAPREAIAPVTILWRPSNAAQRVRTSELPIIGEGAGQERQLWIWVHPSAFDNALLVLSKACDRQGLDDLQRFVKCRSRRGDLARIDIFGRRADELLRKVLRPIPRKLSHLSSSADIARVSGHQDLNTHVTTTMSPHVRQPLSARIFAMADCFPAAAVLALDVYDPRDTARSFYSGGKRNLSESAPDVTDDKNLPSDSPSSCSHAMDEEVEVQGSEPPVDLIEDIGLTPWENSGGNGLSEETSDSPYLWSPQPERKLAALSQKAFSEKRHKRRNAYLTGVGKGFLLPNLEGAPDSRVEQSEACPVLLLKQAHSRPSASGWSVIMPITWVQAFWVPLVFAGGHVIGLRERHWLATDAGLPYFPHDFPDCPAHAQHLAIENAAFNTANQARPPSKRIACFAVSPLQRSIMYAYKDHTLNSSGSTAGVACELSSEHHGGQSIEGACTTPAVGLPTLTDLDGDTAMTEAVSSAVGAAVGLPTLTDLDGDTAMTDAVSSAVGEPSSPASLIIASEFRTVDGDTDKAADVNKVTRSPVSKDCCENVQEVNPLKPNAALVQDPESLIEPLPDTGPSLEVALHGTDGEILAEFASSEGDTPMIGTGTMVSSSLVPSAGCQIMDGRCMPELMVPLGYHALNEGCPFVQDRFLSVHSVDGSMNSPFSYQDGDIAMHGIEGLARSSAESPELCQVVDGPFIPEFSSLEGEGQTVARVIAESVLNTSTGQTVDGVRVPELIKPLGDTERSEVESLSDRVPSIPVASRNIDEAVVPEVTDLHGDFEIVATDSDVSRASLLEMVYNPTEGVNLEQLTKPHGDDRKILDDFAQDGVKPSSLASLLEQPVVTVNESEENTSGRCRFGDNGFPTEEMIGTRPTELHNLEVPPVMGNVTDSGRRHESPVLLPGISGDHTFVGLNPTVRSANSTRPLFVARTVVALMTAFNGNGLRKALLLCSGFLNTKSVQHGLRKGALEWRASHEPVETSASTDTSKIHELVGVHGTACYVRVQIVVPRRGVLKENGLLCCPTKEDFEAFSSSSQHWQGVEASWSIPQAKEELKKIKRNTKKTSKRKQKGEASKSSRLQSNTDAEDFAKRTTDLDVAYEDCCSREAIGCITSSGPQGSSWSGVGVCEVSSLMKLRAMQWQDKRWWDKKEILVLAGNRLSPILRPVLVSIVLELGPEQDIIW